MKKISLSLVAIATLSFYASANAQSLNEALKNGKVSGEVAATYENRNFDRKVNGDNIYYQDTAYSIGSFALKYETSVWNNLSLTSKFRAYGTIYEEDKNSQTYYGTGDATERFYEKNGSTRSVDIEELFLAYNLENISVKTGRQAISSDWMNKTHDAVKIDANWGDTSIEAIWSLRDGRIYSRDYRPMEKMNGNDGVYKLGLTQKFNENISATTYGLIMPDMKDIYGARTNLTFEDTKVRLHYAISQEDAVLRNDSSIIDVMVSSSIAGFSPYIGYVKVDKDAAFPGYSNSDSNDSGEIIVPFEEGDYLYSKDAQTIYLGIAKSFGDLSTSVLYGTTRYDAGNEMQKNHETSLWLGYPIMKDLKAKLGYTIVDEDENSAASDYDQVNFTLAYSF
jgi:hypothetical protein